ncbi:hypothetical protein EON73_03010 [bacterium]|nr:MAG: hypothetical protein EON73_03010 [bacterium]
MTATTLIQELEMLPLTDRLFVIEQTLKSIRLKKNNLKTAAEELYNDYKTDDELTLFTMLDSEPFYEAR